MAKKGGGMQVKQTKPDQANAPTGPGGARKAGANVKHPKKL